MNVKKNYITPKFSCSTMATDVILASNVNSLDVWGYGGIWE